jgi:hypothetical protein
VPPTKLDIPTAGGLLRFRKGAGWATFEHDDGPVIVLLRFQEVAGRIETTELHLVGRDGAAVTGTAVRSIPLGSIETAVNGPAARPAVLEHIAADGPAFKPGDFGPVRKNFLDLMAELKEHPGRPSRVLKVPTGRARPDDFYAKVAELYTWLAGPGGSRRPAVDIANDNDVPVSTVHRWLREARQRGLMGAGQRGAS